MIRGDDIATLADFVIEEAREAQALHLDPAKTQQAVAAAVGDPARARYYGGATLTAASRSAAPRVPRDRRRH